jgi:hypothetical protein
MAVDLDPNAFFTRVDTVPDLPLSFGLWLRIDAFPHLGTGYQYAGIFYLGSEVGIAGSITFYIEAVSGTPTANPMWVSFSFGDDVQISLPAARVPLDEWMFIGVTISGSGAANLYQRFESETSFSLTDTGQDGGSYVNEKVNVGYDQSTADPDSEQFDGSVAYVRLFAAELSEADMLLESQSPIVVDTGNVYADWSMYDASGNDDSGEGNHLTPVIGDGDFTVVDDPQLLDPNTGLGAFRFDIEMQGDGLGEYSGSGAYSFDIAMGAAGIAPAIPSGEGHFSMDFALEAIGETLNVGSADFGIQFGFFGPLSRGPVIVESVGLPGVPDNLPFPIEVRLKLVDPAGNEIRGYYVDPITGHATIVPDYRFLLNLVTAQWALPFLPTEHIRPLGTMYRRVLWSVEGEGPLAVDDFVVPEDTPSPEMLHTLVVGL